MEKSRSRQLSAKHWPFGGFKPLSQERLEKKRAAEKRLQPRKLSRFFNLLDSNVRLGLKSLWMAQKCFQSLTHLIVIMVCVQTHEALVANIGLMHFCFPISNIHYLSATAVSKTIKLSTRVCDFSSQHSWMKGLWLSPPLRSTTESVDPMRVCRESSPK